jgi:hypothetical protein
MGWSSRMKVSAGQIRTWKSRYFQLTPPNEGWEYFLVLNKEGDGKWTVRFAAGKNESMLETTIEDLTDVLAG